jgi:hypothetical protein
MNLFVRKKSGIFGGLPLLPVALVLVFSLAACGGNSAENKTSSSGDGSVSFANDVLPIIDSRCAQCHGGERTERGLNLLSYNSLMAGSVNGPMVVPGNADASKFVELVANNKMPKRGARLTPSQVQIFTDWVNQGALDN